MAERTIPPKDQASYDLADAGDFSLGPDSAPIDGVPPGTRFVGRLGDSPIYPGNTHDYWVHLTADHDPAKPPPLLVVLDGHIADERFRLTTVIENLVHRGELPPIVSVYVSPGGHGPGAGGPTCCGALG